MIREICRDQFLLTQKASEASMEDIKIIQDMIDTANSQKERICIGMAANIIGIPKQIMIVKEEDSRNWICLINPKVLSTSVEFYHAFEACLCHDEEHQCQRFKKVKLEYLDENFKRKIKTFSGLTGQVIQHEMDHFKGILI